MKTRTHKHKAGSAFNSAHARMLELDAAMAGADDFEADDKDARKRSDLAKSIAATAHECMKRGQYEDAVKQAVDAMRILGGD